MSTGRVIEFVNEDIEKLQRRVAEELGFELVDHRLELYGVPKGGKKPDRPSKLDVVLEGLAREGSDQ